MHPHGTIGKMFASIMEKMNTSSYHWVIRQMSGKKTDRILEIGFGTGKLGEMMISELGCSSYLGVDPSELMVETAEKHLKRKRRKIEVDLRVGDDRCIEQIGAQINVVVAVHSFQFWEFPEQTLKTIQSLLAPDNSLILVLRLHGKNPPNWLPNPVARSGDEINKTLALLETMGFEIYHHGHIGSESFGIHASYPINQS